jgi:hypothetical protein
MTEVIRNAFWGGQIEAVLKEIVREASICHVKLLEPGMVEAVLHNDEVACGSTNPMAFKKLREMVMLAFVVREKAMDRLGAVEGAQLAQTIRDALVAKLGDRLGGRH